MPGNNRPSRLIQAAVCFSLALVNFPAVAQSPRGQLGLALTEAPRAIRANGSTYACLVISGFDPNGPARFSPLRANDCITDMNGQLFPSIDYYDQLMGSLRPGMIVNVGYRHGPRRQFTQLLVGDGGVYDKIFNAIIRQQPINAPDGSGGVAGQIVAVGGPSPFQPGDEIFGMDGRRFRSLAEMTGYLRSLPATRQVRLEFFSSRHHSAPTAVDVAASGSGQNGITPSQAAAGVGAAVVFACLLTDCLSSGPTGGSGNSGQTSPDAADLQDMARRRTNDSRADWGIAPLPGTPPNE